MIHSIKYVSYTSSTALISSIHTGTSSSSYWNGVSSIFSPPVDLDLDGFCFW